MPTAAKRDPDIGRDNKDLLTEIRERFDYATQEWSKIREEAKIDMRYIAGDIWDPTERKAREEAKRPALDLDELGQYVNQTVNSVRANPRAIKFTPNGNGADDKSAEFYINKAREIEYRSKAQIVYTTAFQNAVERSYGFFRVVTRWVPGKFEQEVWLEPFVNPDLVTPDPDALSPTLADQKFCFVSESRDEPEFLREWPNATVRSFNADNQKLAPSWFKGKRIQIAEYWHVKPVERHLLQILPPPPPAAPPGAVLSLNQAPQSQAPQPIEVYAHELEKRGLPKLEDLRAGGLLRAERKEDVPEVWSYITNGIEVLSKSKWPGKYIPIVSCFGKVIWVDAGSGAERKILSMIRLARDPQMLYCYYRTQQAETAKLIPKSMVVGYKGQFRGVEDRWMSSTDEPVAYLEVNVSTDALPEGTILPLPQRIPYEAGPNLSALELAAEGARRAIQAAMAIAPLPSTAQRRNEKSGKALERIEESSARGSYHFDDSYNAMIEQGGVIIEDLLDKVLDTMRETGIRKADDTAELVTINDPNDPDSPSTKGDHLVTVSTGPEQHSEREAASDFADVLAQIPPVFAQIGDLVVKMKNLGPIGDQIAERLTPPQYRKREDGKAPSAEDLQRELADAKGQLDQLKQVAQQMHQALETEQAKQQATLKKAALDAKKDITLQVMKNATTIAVAKINALTKGVEMANEAEVERLALEADAQQAELERQHGAEQADIERQHAAEQQQQQHANSLEAGAAGHAQTLEQQQLAADAAAQQQQQQAEAGA